MGATITLVGDIRVKPEGHEPFEAMVKGWELEDYDSAHFCYLPNCAAFVSISITEWDVTTRMKDSIFDQFEDFVVRYAAAGAMFHTGEDEPEAFGPSDRARVEAKILWHEEQLADHQYHLNELRATLKDLP